MPLDAITHAQMVSSFVIVGGNLSGWNCGKGAPARGKTASSVSTYDAERPSPMRPPSRRSVRAVVALKECGVAPPQGSHRVARSDEFASGSAPLGRSACVLPPLSARAVKRSRARGETWSRPWCPWSGRRRWLAEPTQRAALLSISAVARAITTPVAATSTVGSLLSAACGRSKSFVQKGSIRITRRIACPNKRIRTLAPAFGTISIWRSYTKSGTTSRRRPA